MSESSKSEGYSDSIKKKLRAIPKVDECLGWIEEHVEAPKALVKDH